MDIDRVTCGRQDAECVEHLGRVKDASTLISPDEIISAVTVHRMS